QSCVVSATPGTLTTGTDGSRPADGAAGTAVGVVVFQIDTGRRARAVGSPRPGTAALAGDTHLAGWAGIAAGAAIGGGRGEIVALAVRTQGPPRSAAIAAAPHGADGPRRAHGAAGAAVGVVILQVDADASAQCLAGRAAGAAANAVDAALSGGAN